MVKATLEKTGVYKSHRNKSVNSRIPHIEYLLSRWPKKVLEIAAVASYHCQGDIEGANTIGEIAVCIFFDEIMEIDCSSLGWSSKQKYYDLLESKIPTTYEESKDFLEFICSDRGGLFIYTPEEYIALMAENDE